MPDLLYYDNDELTVDLRSITRDIAVSGFQPQYIFGVARGGLVPAVALSHYYKVPMISATVSLRDSQVIDGLDELVNLLISGAKVLMVDDICDSGETLAVIQKEIKEQIVLPKGVKSLDALLKSAVLWHNPAQTRFTPTYFGREINRNDDDSWVVFPWESWWKF